MRFAFVAALSFVFAGTAVFLACSSDDPAGTGSSTSSSSSSTTSSGSSSGQQVEEDDDDDNADSGILTGKNGCLIHCTDYQKAAKAESVPRPDVPTGIAWETPEGALSVDGQFARVTLQDGQESAYLALSDYSFTLADNADPYGITVELTRQAVDGGINDATIEVILDTAETPRTKVLKQPWPRLIVGVHHYGQEIDTWGTNLFPRNVNAKTFGTRIAAKRQAGVTGPVTGLVDALKIRVCYCNADGK